MIPNLTRLKQYLKKSGYKKDGNWFTDNDFMVKFNKTSITLKGKGTQLIYVNPNNITEEVFLKIIMTSMV